MMGNKMETTIVYWEYTGITQEKMEATKVFRTPRIRQVSSVSKGLVCFACSRVHLGW